MAGVVAVHPSSVAQTHRSVCGNFLTSRKSVVAFVWTITVLLTLGSFLSAGVVIIHTHTSYNNQNDQNRRLIQTTQPIQTLLSAERHPIINRPLLTLEEQDSIYRTTLERDLQENNNNNNNNNDRNSNSADRDEPDRQQQEILLTAKSLTFTAVYTIFLSLGLTLYGSMAVVGFTSLRGVYITPCLAPTSNLKFGIFGGAIIVFGNFLIVSAIMCSGIQVQDGNEAEQQQRIPHEIERIAAIIAITCIFLAAVYAVFAILLFLYFDDDNEEEDDMFVEMSNHNLLSAVDTRRENFITMPDHVS